jgi:hypothetical protein
VVPSFPLRCPQYSPSISPLSLFVVPSFLHSYLIIISLWSPHSHSVAPLHSVSVAPLRTHLLFLQYPLVFPSFHIILYYPHSHTVVPHFMSVSPHSHLLFLQSPNYVPLLALSFPLILPQFSPHSPFLKNINETALTRYVHFSVHSFV